MSDQIPYNGQAAPAGHNPFENADLLENPEPRCACVLLLDTSHSMHGRPMEQLNEAVGVYLRDVCRDSLAAKRVEVAVVTFGGEVTTVADFASPDRVEVPTLVASGATPMGEALERAIDMVAARKRRYKEAGVLYYRPWLMLITDGAPTDDWPSAARSVRAGEAADAFVCFAVGVEDADLGILGQIATRPPLKLKGLEFRELFMWLSASQKSVSSSRPGDKVPLPPVAGWAEV